MPPARKSTRSTTSRRASAFKEPAALKKLNQSLDSAQKALGDLRAHAGKDASTGSKTLYKGLGKFVSDARRDTTKFTSALKKDFDAAAKAAQSAAKTATGATRRSSSTRSSSKTSGSTAKSSTRSTGTSRARKTGSSASRSTRKSS